MRWLPQDRPPLGRRMRQRSERFAAVVDRRAPLMEAGQEFLRKAFPDHWSFLLGEMALYSFAVLVLTGSFLTLYFEPGMVEGPYHGSYRPLDGVRVSEAYSSVMDISFDVRGGLMIRQIHHWAALVFVGALMVHMLRIFFTGAFRRPRELNWLIGVTLFLLSLLEGFCGYSLPDDLLSGTGLRTAEGIVQSIPVVGTYLVFFIFRGQYPGHVINERLYITHVLFVPGLLIALITAHLFLVVYLKHTQWPQPGRKNRNVIGKPLFPMYTTKSLGLFFGLSGILAALSATMQINPIWEYGPYRPDQASIDSQPDWYLGYLEGALRLMPAAETNFLGHTLVWDVFLPGAVLPAILFLVLYAYPLFERWITGDTGEHHLCDRPRNQPVRTALGVAGITEYTVLLLAGGQDVLQRVFRPAFSVYTWGLRVGFFVFPVLAFWVTRRLCLALQAQDRMQLAAGVPTDVVRREDGGYREGRRDLLPEDRTMMMVRDTPVPLRLVRRRFAPVRALLRVRISRLFYRDRVELPLTEEQRRELADVLAEPPEKSGS